MFLYEFCDGYNYDILPKQTLSSGDVVDLMEDNVPHLAFRFYYPSFYPTVRFIIRDKFGKFIEDVSSKFKHHDDFQKELVSEDGPLIKMKFMQDYINDYLEPHSDSHFKFNSSYDGKNLWCEAEVISDKGVKLRTHSQFLALRWDRKYV